MQYSDKVMDHYEHPRNVGTLDKNEKDWHRHGGSSRLRRCDALADQSQS